MLAIFQSMNSFRESKVIVCFGGLASGTPVA